MALDVADSELKARHRAMWASGDYPQMVDTFLLPLGPRLVDALPHRRRARACSTSPPAPATPRSPPPRAARSVTASDLTPELLEAGRRRADAEGLDLEWVQADAENLPFEDASFDVVMSSIGVMFAPHHQAAADELVRVCRPGGTIGLLCWTPEGMLGALFRTMKPFMPPPPPGRPAPAAVGQRGAPAGADRRPRRVPHARARRARDHRLRAPARLRRALQGPLRTDDRRPGQRRRARAARPSSTRRWTRFCDEWNRGTPTARASRRSTCSPSGTRVVIPAILARRGAAAGRRVR